MRNAEWKMIPRRILDCRRASHHEGGRGEPRRRVECLWSSTFEVRSSKLKRILNGGRSSCREATPLRYGAAGPALSTSLQKLKRRGSTAAQATRLARCACGNRDRPGPGDSADGRSRAPAPAWPPPTDARVRPPRCVPVSAASARRQAASSHSGARRAEPAHHAPPPPPEWLT